VKPTPYRRAASRPVFDKRAPNDRAAVVIASLLPRLDA
jgi:hypothetical protein